MEGRRTLPSASTLLLGEARRTSLVRPSHSHVIGHVSPPSSTRIGSAPVAWLVMTSRSSPNPSSSCSESELLADEVRPPEDGLDALGASSSTRVIRAGWLSSFATTVIMLPEVNIEVTCLSKLMSASPILANTIST